MIKMVVTDLDETLLRTDKSITEYTIDIIKKVRDSGMKIIYATARGDDAISLIPYDLFDGCVLMNGAKAYVDKKIIYERTISPDIFTSFLCELSNKNFRVAAEICGVHYANFNVKEEWSYIDNFIITDYVNVSGNADKLYALVENSNQLDYINSILPRELYLHLSRDNLPMIMHKEATKYNGVLKVANEFRISQSEIIAFGDDMNDKEMLLNFGIGIAMDNSIDEIKMVADYICDTNNNDGVAKWLDENIVREIM